MMRRACIAGRRDAVTLLLDHGADAAAPLQFQVAELHPDVARLLRERAGAGAGRAPAGRASVA